LRETSDTINLTGFAPKPVQDFKVCKTYRNTGLDVKSA
jgi:hypothetical protein